MTFVAQVVDLALQIGFSDIAGDELVARIWHMSTSIREEAL